MAQELPRRPGISGPALIRLLARLTHADVPEPGHTLPNRLSQWLSWADAIALSGALSGPPPVMPASDTASDDAGQAEFDRVRLAQQAAILGHRTAAGPRQRAQQRQAVPSETGAPRIDYALYRQRYVSLQQSMETSIIHLRSRLRTLLASRSQKMAKLAVVDAAMEQALGGQEQRLLATVPGLLEQRFEQLRQQAQDQDSHPAMPGKTTAWQDVFQQDMQRVLLAELDIRLQPVEGLLAALRAR